MNQEQRLAMRLDLDAGEYRQALVESAALTEDFADTLANASKQLRSLENAGNAFRIPKGMEAFGIPGRIAPKAAHGAMVQESINRLSNALAEGYKQAQARLAAATAKIVQSPPPAFGGSGNTPASQQLPAVADDAAKRVDAMVDHMGVAMGRAYTGLMAMGSAMTLFEGRLQSLSAVTAQGAQAQSSALTVAQRAVKTVEANTKAAVAAPKAPAPIAGIGADGRARLLQTGKAVKHDNAYNRWLRKGGAGSADANKVTAVDAALGESFRNKFMRRQEAFWTGTTRQDVATRFEAREKAIDLGRQAEELLTRGRSQTVADAAVQLRSDATAAEQRIAIIQKARAQVMADSSLEEEQKVEALAELDHRSAKLRAKAQRMVAKAADMEQRNRLPAAEAQAKLLREKAEIEMARANKLQKSWAAQVRNGLAMGARSLAYSMPMTAAKVGFGMLGGRASAKAPLAHKIPVVMGNAALAEPVKLAAKSVMRLGHQAAKTGANVAGMGKAAGGAAQGLSALHPAAGMMLSMGARAGVAAASVVSLAAAVRSAAQHEQDMVAFTTMLGDAGKAQSLLGDITQFSAATPFQMPELVSASKGLLAFGVAQDQIIPTMRVLGDLSAGLNIPIGELAELYGKAKVQGRLFMVDINQLTGRGIPVIGELAKQFGVTEGQVRNLVEEGKIGFPEMQRALVSLTGKGGRFGGLMEAQSKTLSGMWSTAQDALGLFLRELGEGLVKAFDLKGAVGWATGASEAARAGLSTAMPYIEWFGAKTREVFAALGTIGSMALGPAVSALSEGFQTLFRFATEGMLGCWEAATPLLSSITSLVGEVDKGAPIAERMGAMLRDALLTAEFGFANLEQVGVAAVLNLQYQFVKNGNDIAHWFTTGLPASMAQFAATGPQYVMDSFTGMFEYLRDSFKVFLAWLGDAEFAAKLDAEQTVLRQQETQKREAERAKMGSQAAAMAGLAAGPRAEDLGERLLRQMAEDSSNRLAGDYKAFMEKRRAELDAAKKPVEKPPAAPIPDPTIEQPALPPGVGPDGKRKGEGKAKVDRAEISALTKGSVEAASAAIKGRVGGDKGQQKLIQQGAQQNALLQQIRDNVKPAQVARIGG